MGAIMWCFHSSHTTCKFIMWSIRIKIYLYFFLHLVRSYLCCLSYRHSVSRGIFVIIVSHWILHMSRKIYGYKSWFVSSSSYVQCLSPSFIYGIMREQADVWATKRDFMRKMFLSHSVIDICILNTIEHTHNNGNSRAQCVTFKRVG